jgi:hypothetical protein
MIESSDNAGPVTAKGSFISQAICCCAEFWLESSGQTEHSRL